MAKKRGGQKGISAVGWFYSQPGFRLPEPRPEPTPEAPKATEGK